MIPITLHPAFLNTSFRVITKPTFAIKIDILVPEVQHLSSWAFITAWNPSPEVFTLEENHKRNASLADAIADMELLYHKE